MMSVIETQFSGEDIIIISPDSDNLSILQVGKISPIKHTSVCEIVALGM